MRRRLQKCFCLLLSLLLVLGTLTACSQSAEKTDNNAVAGNSGKEETKKEEAGIYDGIEPLETETELNFGYLTGSHHGMIIYMIDKMGGYEKAGIRANIETF
ncbi:hypothetical protein, partial [Hungatella effluvii]